MYIIRELFHAKPGKAKDLVKMFKQAVPHFEKSDEGKNFKVLTDITGNYWTVVVEFEVEDIGSFMKNIRSGTGTPELQQIMKGYIDLLEGGKREIFLVE
jgi:hypothetical protein